MWTVRRAYTKERAAPYSAALSFWIPFSTFSLKKLLVVVVILVMIYTVLTGCADTS